MEANYEIKIFRLNIVDVLVTVDFDACVIRRLEFFKLCERLSDKPVNAPGTARRIVEDLIEVFSVSEKAVLMS